MNIGISSVDAWYNKVYEYNFNNTGFPSAGHFIQVIWKGTTIPDTAASDTITDLALEIFREQITARHNYYRAQHRVGILQRDSELERIAQDAADYINYY